VLGALMEGRRHSLWLERGRLLVTVLLPWMPGGWFGIGHQDVRLALLLALWSTVSAALPGWRAGFAARAA